MPLHLAQAAALVGQATLSPEPGPLPLDRAAAAGDMLEDMLAGIARWRAHEWRRPEERAPVLWSDGATELRDHGGGTGRPVLVLPSLINGSEVLDIHPERSLLGTLRAAGLRPLLLDWGVPGAEEHGFGLADYADLRLRPALAVARVLAGGPVPVLGYCMGGAMAAAAAARRASDVAALVTIGTPWNCQEGIWIARMVRELVRPDPAMARAALQTMGASFGLIPHDAVQTLFAGLDPGLALRKFARFTRMEGLEAELFVAVEDWLNRPVPLAPAVAEEVLIDWQLHNTLAAGVWEVMGGPVTPDAIACPTLSFCARRDRIAPPANADALPGAIPGARIARPDTGHVGMIVGQKARAEVFEPIVDFLDNVRIC
ncbi:alpha/beta fold hydrolase [Pontivivens ytuae]|uniref:Alpha/beta fold hydrolase n=1 Tax=Pontivivens ytuae TaxID=2789856 RepID=A0A7S9LTJ4_9RHOB|nr:alpha/beta fold hydrolase [Pontivivens ytuae]QPH55052.1 alpha/beta fold hydrolase [Pontivivens ytuae]